MRVLHYVDENRLAWMEPWLQLLGELRTQGVENIVLCKPGGTLSSRAADCGFEVFVHKPIAQWLPMLSGEVGRIIDRVRPDIIHTRLSAAARIGGYWGSCCGIPVISTLDKYPKKKYYRNSDVLVGCSSYLTEAAKSMFTGAVINTTIFNPVDVSHYLPDISAKKTPLQYSEDAGKKVILGAGRFVDWKGFDVLIKAFAQIRERRSDAILWLAGDGEDREKLTKLVLELGLVNDVRFLGWIKDLRPYFWESDVFVLPTRTAEPFGLVLLEAMASGVPVVATAAGGPLDMVDSTCGRLVSPGSSDTLASGINDVLDEDKHILRKGAIAKAALFDVSEIAGHYATLYQEVSQNNGSII